MEDKVIDESMECEELRKQIESLDEVQKKAIRDELPWIEGGSKRGTTSIPYAFASFLYK